MVREDLVNSAVSFLQEPSVATAPVDQRIAFLRSKNLTQEEIDLSLQRAGTEAPSSSQTPYQQPPYQSQTPPPSYASYQNGYYQQPPPPPPPELPRRDWRDYFIMATVVGGVGYGVYALAQRYVVPLIAPPTPPQLESDKAAIDASFEKAFALLDQLATDTTELKASETARTERLDTALTEVESVVEAMKEASKRRDEEGRRLNDEIRALKDMLPKAMEAARESADNRLKELSGEMKSLKTLVQSRMTGGPANSTPPPVNRPNPTAPTFSPASSTAATPTPAQTAALNPQDGADAVAALTGENKLDTKPAVPDRGATTSPYGRMMNGRAAIPAWQMAAAKKNQEAKEKSGTVENGNGEAGAVDGAAA